MKTTTKTTTTTTTTKTTATHFSNVRFKNEDHLPGDIGVGTKLCLSHIGSDLRKFGYY